jgi:hypothetical protein
MNAIGVKVKIIEPGMVATDFGGRSFDFSNDDSLTEYQELIQGVFAGFGAANEGASTPESIAEVIYLAATDGSGQLRYTAGDDAAMLLQKRKADSDEVFLGGIEAAFSGKPVTT